MTCLVLVVTLWPSSPQPPNAQAPRELHPLLDSIRQKYDLPAMAGAIVTSEGIWARGVAGVRKYGTDTPVTIDDQFHLGSDTRR
ncbi:MAG TPA: hypothetical protein VIW28_03670 [Gemmatimonadales bacterium]